MASFLRTTTIRGIPARLRDRVLMQPAVQKLLHRFGHELEGKKWVFVLGCYNSGTTLLAEMLQSHPRLDGLPNEGAFLSDVLPYPERFGWPRMWCKCADELRVPVDDFERAQRIRRQWSLWLRGDPEFVVEKTISNVLRVEFLANTFPDARFVYIVRNGYAVAAGIRGKANLRRWKNPEGLKEYPIELCAEQWAESNRVVRQAFKQVAGGITVRYEDLTAAPLATLNRLWASLGVEEMDDSMSWNDMQIHEVRSAVRNMNDRSIRNLDSRDREAIRSVASSELDRYGYGEG